jgi:hypothetical protein
MGLTFWFQVSYLVTCRLRYSKCDAKFLVLDFLSTVRREKYLTLVNYELVKISRFEYCLLIDISLVVDL